MNYLTEIKLFYDWLETHELSANGIALWHAIMQIANRSRWQREIKIRLSLLSTRSSLSKTTIYKERDILKQLGLIDFIVRGGRSVGIYRINSFESRLVSATRIQSETQAELESRLVFGRRTQIESDNIRLNYTDIKEKRKIEVADKSAPLSISPTPERKEKSCAKKKRNTPLLFSR